MNADLLQDLTAYKTSRDKGVVNAARSLIALYREAAPEMLLRKDRGKEVSMAMSGRVVTQNLQFGVERNVSTKIEGLELLEAWKKEHGELDEDEEDNEDGRPDCGERLNIDWKEWEVGSEEEEDSDDGGGWIDVSSDEDHGIDISDSDDDDKEQKPRPLQTENTTSSLATSRVFIFIISFFLKFRFSRPQI
jgi:protein SDA1